MTCWPTSAEVFGADAGLHWPELAARLAARFPERWDGASARRGVRRAAAAEGVPSVVVWGDGTALKGCRLADVEQAAAR